MFFALRRGGKREVFCLKNECAAKWRGLNAHCALRVMFGRRGSDGKERQAPVSVAGAAGGGGEIFAAAHLSSKVFCLF